MMFWPSLTVSAVVTSMYVLRKVLKYSQGFKVDEEETYLHFRTHPFYFWI